MGRGNFEAGKECPIVKYTAGMDHRNQVFDGGPEMLRDVAMATDFGTQFVITGFVGYNFGCMIGSDTLFDSRTFDSNK